MFAWWLSDCIKNKWNVLERLWGVIVMCSILNFLPHLFHQIMVKTLVQHKNWKTNSMKLQFPRLLVLHTTGSFKIRLKELLRTKMKIALNCGIFKKYELYLAGTIVASLDDKPGHALGIRICGCSLFYKRELWASKSAGAHSTKSLKISGCKRWCPKDLRVRAPAAPALTHSLFLDLNFSQDHLKY